MNWFLLLGIVAIIFAASLAFAQQYYNGPVRLCVDRDILINQLRTAGETLRGVGIRQGGGVAELWVKDTYADPSWSIVISMPRGQSCMVGNGNAWTVVDHGHLKVGEPIIFEGDRK